jgi:hypothetical protein
MLSGHATPALPVGPPASYCLLVADQLDLPQAATVTTHGVRGLVHSIDHRQLRELPLNPGLLDEDEIGWERDLERAFSITHSFLASRLS